MNKRDFDDIDDWDRDWWESSTNKRQCKDSWDLIPGFPENVDPGFSRDRERFDSGYCSSIGSVSPHSNPQREHGLEPDSTIKMLSDASSPDPDPDPGDYLIDVNPSVGTTNLSHSGSAEMPLKSSLDDLFMDGNCAYSDSLFDIFNHYTKDDVKPNHSAGSTNFNLNAELCMVLPLASTNDMCVAQSKGIQPILDCSSNEVKSESDARATNFQDLTLTAESAKAKAFDFLTGCHAIQRFKIKLKDGCPSIKGIDDLEEIVELKLKFGELSIIQQPLKVEAVEKFSSRDLEKKRSAVSCRNVQHGIALAMKWRELQNEAIDGGYQERKKVNNKFTNYVRSSRTAGNKLEHDFIFKKGLTPFCSYKEIEDNCKITLIIFNNSGMITYNSSSMYKENILFFLETESNLFWIKSIKGFCRNH